MRKVLKLNNTNSGVSVKGKTLCDQMNRTDFWPKKMPHKRRAKSKTTWRNELFFRNREPTSGSFVRPKKVNTGVSLLHALQERYGRIEDERAGVIEEELFVVGKGKQTTVEMVGAKSVNIKQRSVGLPWHANSIVCSNPETRTKEKLPPRLCVGRLQNFFCLELIRTCHTGMHRQITDWLNLNWFYNDDFFAHFCFLAPFCSRHARLNRHFSSKFDQLREVVLRGELVCHGEPPGVIQNTIPNVTDLDISKCLIGSWQTVSEITSQLKNLKTLNVRYSQTKQIFSFACVLNSNREVFKTGISHWQNDQRFWQWKRS